MHAVNEPLQKPRVVWGEVSASRADDSRKALDVEVVAGGVVRVRRADGVRDEGLRGGDGIDEAVEDGGIA